MGIERIKHLSMAFQALVEAMVMCCPDLGVAFRAKFRACLVF